MKAGIITAVELSTLIIKKLLSCMKIRIQMFQFKKSKLNFLFMAFLLEIQ